VVSSVCICVKGAEANETACVTAACRLDENWLLPVNSALVLLVLLMGITP
jgi:hypothetical protein